MAYTYAADTRTRIQSPHLRLVTARASILADARANRGGTMPHSPQPGTRSNSLLLLIEKARSHTATQRENRNVAISLQHAIANLLGVLDHAAAVAAPGH